MVLSLLPCNSDSGSLGVFAWSIPRPQGAIHGGARIHEPSDCQKTAPPFLCSFKPKAVEATKCIGAMISIVHRVWFQSQNGASTNSMHPSDCQRSNTHVATAPLATTPSDRKHSKPASAGTPAEEILRPKSDSRPLTHVYSWFATFELALESDTRL